jgi:hypothetical protein
MIKQKKEQNMVAIVVRMLMIMMKKMDRGRRQKLG